MSNTHTAVERNLARVVLILLLIGCYLVMRPFISAMLWAIVLVCASWPIYNRMLKWSGDRQKLVASLITIGMLLIILCPFLIVGSTLADNVQDLTGAAKRLIADGPPPPPAWLGKIPVLGAHAIDYWQAVAQDTAKLWTELRKLLEPVSAWLLRLAFGLGGGLLELALSIFIAFFLFANGPASAKRLVGTVDRIGGDRGLHLLNVASSTIRGVVYGIIGTALIQSVMAGIGFFIAGVPNAGLLALFTFFFAVLPVVGTGVVCFPVAIWLFYQGSTGWGIFMVIWALAVGSLDNFVKPWLISQGSDLPFLLIFFGVIGGALSFGFIGVFLGPTLLAVGYRLIEEWNSMAAGAPIPAPGAIPKTEPAVSAPIAP